MGPGILEAGGDFDFPESPPSEDLFPDYIVTVVVPLIIAIVLCLLLAYVMFGRREGVYAANITPTIHKFFIPTNRGVTHFSFLIGKKGMQEQTSKYKFILSQP